MLMMRVPHLFKESHKCQNQNMLANINLLPMHWVEDLRSDKSMLRKHAPPHNFEENHTSRMSKPEMISLIV